MGSRKRMFWFEDIDIIKRTEFTVDECHEHAKRIEELLGSEWFAEQLRHPQPLSHPLVSKWTQMGVSSVIDFSTLSLDLKTLQECQGFGELVSNLRDTKKYVAAEHEAHIAALFKRSDAQDLRLGPKINGKRPDVKFKIGGEDFFVECKTFEESKVHGDFRNLAERFRHEISSKMEKNNTYCATKIEFSEPFFNVSPERVLETVEKSIVEFKGDEIIKEEKSFSVKVYNTPIFARNVEYRKAHMIHVLSPIDPKEVQRITNTMNKARRQLPDNGNNMICLELPHFAFIFPEQIISTVSVREFQKNYNEKIGAILLSKRSMTQIAAKYLHCDNLYPLRNPSAINKIPIEILEHVSPTGWLELLPQRTRIPFYEHITMPFEAKFPKISGC